MSNNESPKYFDLHTTGIGYLNRIRAVTPQAGNPFLAVTIAALRGSVDRPEAVSVLIDGRPVQLGVVGVDRGDLDVTMLEPHPGLVEREGPVHFDVRLANRRTGLKPVHRRNERSRLNRTTGDRPSSCRIASTTPRPLLPVTR